jgi:hypothetical protein
MPTGSSEGVLGTGTTITFATTAFTGQMTNLSQSGKSRPMIKTTHMGTPDTTGTGSDTFQPGLIVDEGTIDFAYHYRPSSGGATSRPVFAAMETITIEFDSSHDTGAQAVFQGAVSDDSWDAPNEDNMTGAGTIKISGAIAWAAAASSA